MYNKIRRESGLGLVECPILRKKTGREGKLDVVSKLFWPGDGGGRRERERERERERNSSNGLSHRCHSVVSFCTCPADVGDGRKKQFWGKTLLTFCLQFPQIPSTQQWFSIDCKSESCSTWKSCVLYIYNAFVNVIFGLYLVYLRYVCIR